MTGWLGWLGGRPFWARLGLVVTVGCLLAAVVLVGPDLPPLARGSGASSAVDDHIPELAFPLDVGDRTTVELAASEPARTRLARGIGLLWSLGFDFPAGNRSRFGLVITVHDCESLPGECDDVRADVGEQARAYPQLEYGQCVVIVDETAVAATAGEVEVDTNRWFAAVIAHELTHCDGQYREDVAETRGTLWVGRKLGDRRIVKDAQDTIEYDIDESGNWKR
jgi:hypothetical protein